MTNLIEKRKFRKLSILWEINCSASYQIEEQIDNILVNRETPKGKKIGEQLWEALKGKVAWKFLSIPLLLLSLLLWLLLSEMREEKKGKEKKGKCEEKWK